MYLHWAGIDSVNLTKGIGFIGGTIFSYFVNCFWTFNQQTTGAGSAGRFILVYLVSLVANIVVNYLSIDWLKASALISEYILLTAFILATGVSAIINFIGMKFFVFTDRCRPR
jgi:putative flippase GtrA